MSLSTENQLQTDRIHLKMLNSNEGFTLFIKYSGCVILKYREESEVEYYRNRRGSVSTIGPIDFLIPGQEEGVIEIKRYRKFKGKFYNKSFLQLCSDEEVGLVQGKLLLRIRNLLFVDAMLFVRCNEQLFRLECNAGPFYLYLSNMQFSTLCKLIFYGRSKD